MWKILIWILLIYLIYRFLRNILSPLIKSAEKQDEAGRGRHGETIIQKRSESSGKSEDEGEYIDYHEIKD